MKVNWLKIISGKAFFYALLMEVFFLLLAFINYPLRKIFTDNSVSPQNETILHYLLAIFIGLFLIYFLIYKEEKAKGDFFKKNFKVLIIFFIIFQITLLLIPPIGSADIYNYIFRAKVLTVYHENPYIVPAGNFPNDPLADYAQAGAGKIPLIYGPVWLGLAILPTILAGKSVLFGVFLFKLLAIIFNSATCYFIFRILGRLKPNYQHFGTIIYAFNPLILFEIANNGHNDIIMMFLVILSIYFFAKNRYYLSFSALLLAVFVKYIALILLPVLILFIFSNLSNKKEKFKFVISCLFITCLLLILNYFAIGKIMFIAKGTEAIAKIFNPFLLPPGQLLFYLFLNPNFSEIQLFVKSFGYLIFLIFYFFILGSFFWQRKKSLVDLVNIFSLIILFYLVLATSQLMPWYLVWFFPLAILLKQYHGIVIFLTGFIPICFYIFLYFLGYFFLLIIFLFYFSFRKFYLKRLV